MCTRVYISYKVVHCGIRDWCIVGFVQAAYTTECNQSVLLREAPSFCKLLLSYLPVSGQHQQPNRMYLNTNDIDEFG